MNPVFLFVTEAEDVFVEVKRTGWCRVGTWPEFRLLPPRDRLALARGRIDEDNTTVLPQQPH